MSQSDKYLVYQDIADGLSEVRTTLNSILEIVSKTEGEVVSHSICPLFQRSGPLHITVIAKYKGAPDATSTTV
ncbi:hypothetical protein Presley_16 [Acinetobacter phage Presley]|uniref:Uncharacterized protein n=1 Tax=Acinetobacter phage Presley TaxID=1406780 RepID=U5PZU4_9CAUD|nr:hypothetical protein Presley_16 [Acinetobacter phage Presley]AGY48083.1 hypothetical protein Presley_16 [Acinetobacter phage Presley]